MSSAKVRTDRSTDHDRLRILRVVQSTYPEVMGGVGLHVHEMSKLQSEMGHQVTVLTTDNGERSLPRRERRDGYAVVRHKEHARPLDNSIAPDVLRSLRAHVSDYDVVHVHSHLYFMSNLAAVYETLADTPMVLTNHGLVSQTAPLPVQKVFLPTIGRLTFEAADRILCYTETDRERLRSRGIGSEITVIHNGIDCSRFQASGAEPRKQILFVGRLKRGKGPQHLLSAFADVAPAYPEYELVFVGEGPMRSELEARSRREGVRSRVRFYGWVENDEIVEYYDRADLFVLPSIGEGLPRTVMEAMACETPVVTTDLPQLRPLVSDVGETVPHADVGALADAIATLLDAEETREAMGQRARERIKREYSWSETVSKTVDVYRELVDGGNGARR